MISDYFGFSSIDSIKIGDHAVVVIDSSYSLESAVNPKTNKDGR